MTDSIDRRFTFEITALERYLSVLYEVQSVSNVPFVYKIMPKIKYSYYCKHVAKRSKRNHINCFYLISQLSLGDNIISSHYIYSYR